METGSHIHRCCKSTTDFSAPSVHYSWKLLKAGPLRLDGGSMFGVLPKAIWTKLAKPDEQNRIPLGHSCLLLERRPDDINLADGAQSHGPQRVLIEAGSGDKFDARRRELYGLTDASIGKAVAAAGVPCDQIDNVIVSHLHFDHAGGLTRLVRPGETPDWVAPSDDPTAPAVKRTFPNARVFVQRVEWEDAVANRAVMTRTYRRENLEPLRDHVKLLDSPAPFPLGYRPQKDEFPATSFCSRRTEVLPGVYVFSVPGHTPGQQAVCFTDDRGRTIVFAADLIPTINHVGAAHNAAYDTEPYISTVTRRWFLEEAVRGDWLLALDHEPGNPLCRVEPDGKGWYVLKPEKE